MTTDTIKELPALLNELGVTVNAVRVDRPNAAPGWVTNKHASYRVSVRYKGRGISLFFYGGTVVQFAPSAADVVYALVGDYDRSVYTLQEFGDEYGWSAETVQAFNTVQRNAVKFKLLFPADEIRIAIAESEY